MTFTPEQVTLLAASVTVLLAALCYLAARKSGYHRGKAEVYQEFADTFRGIEPMFGYKDKTRRRLEAHAAAMRLMLIDPHIREGFRAAVVDADEHWGKTDLAIGDKPPAAAMHPERQT